MPSSGGEYVYLTQAYGPTWGFMTGWVSFFAGFSAPIALAALAFSDYLAQFFPALHLEDSRRALRFRRLEIYLRLGASSSLPAHLALHDDKYIRSAARRAPAERT